MKKYKEAQDLKDKMDITKYYFQQGQAVQTISLAPLDYPQVCDSVPCQNDWVDQSKKGNNPMYVDNDKHIESSKINYLTDRAQTIFFHKVTGLERTFGFGTDPAPTTSQELVDRFVTGKFMFKEPSKKDTKGYFYRPMENIVWKDPSVKEDQAGLDKANADLNKLMQDTKDTIAIGTPSEGLAAVKALDAWTPTVGNA